VAARYSLEYSIDGGEQNFPLAMAWVGVFWESDQNLLGNISYIRRQTDR
jgi:hypothetical protein